jgi:hypothetical protein
MKPDLSFLNDLFAKHTERGRVSEIHTHPCAHCPSAHWPPDDEMIDYMTAPLEIKLDSVFRCGWRDTKACKGLCDLLEVTPDQLREFAARENAKVSP